MIETVMNKLGYKKINLVEETILGIIMDAHKENNDIFIDSLKKKDAIRVYIKDSKTRKTKISFEIEMKVRK